MWVYVGACASVLCVSVVCASVVRVCMCVVCVCYVCVSVVSVWRGNKLSLTMVSRIPTRWIRRVLTA